MHIKTILAREIFDSRGKSTIEIGVGYNRRQVFLSQVPSGKSTGKAEAVVFPFPRIRSVFKPVSTRLKNRSFPTIAAFDNYLGKLDATPRKTKLGGNLCLGLSVAFAKALAFQKRKQVWEELRKEFFAQSFGKKRPLILSNFINGGLHAENNLAIQEYLIYAHPKISISDSVKKLVNLYQKLGAYLKRANRLPRLAVGDESGFVLDFADNFKPLQILAKLIRRSRLDKEFSLGVDAAASSFFRDGTYAFDGKSRTPRDLWKTYHRYFQRLKILSGIEDPFAESDPIWFHELRKAHPDKWIVGDDLTATNPRLIRKFAFEKNINAVIIKPNQNGTISGTGRAIQAARDQKVKIIVSHRSGETEDLFIIHLAKACGAEAVKIGAPVRERISKFNELIRLYD